MDSQAKTVLENQLKRIITKLFKDYLVIIEDVKQDHLSVVSGLATQFPPEFIQQWNYLDLPRYSRIRKKVLDSGNDALREMSTVLDDFSISLDNSKDKE